MSRGRGFTLLELVLVIVLLGILSIAAYGRWGGTSEASAATARDQLLTRLRLVQLQNMNEPGLSSDSTARCSWLRIDVDRFVTVQTSGRPDTCATPAAQSSMTTTALQQGGQLKDMFGGAGNAAKALGGYVLGLVNPATLAAAAGVAEYHDVVHMNSGNGIFQRGCD